MFSYFCQREGELVVLLHGLFGRGAIEDVFRIRPVHFRTDAGC